MKVLKTVNSVINLDNCKKIEVLYTEYSTSPSVHKYEIRIVVDGDIVTTFNTDCLSLVESIRDVIAEVMVDSYDNLLLDLVDIEEYDTTDNTYWNLLWCRFVSGDHKR